MTLAISGFSILLIRRYNSSRTPISPTHLLDLRIDEGGIAVRGSRFLEELKSMFSRNFRSSLILDVAGRQVRTTMKRYSVLSDCLGRHLKRAK
jgi:hypothetical protein